MPQLRAISLLLGFVLFFTTLLSAQSEYKYSYVPKKVYANQLFPVTVIGLGVSGNEVPEFTFESTYRAEPLFDEPLIIRNGNDSFYTFYFKAEKKDVRIPSLIISTSDNQIELPSQNIQTGTLKNPEGFTQVLAADLKIKNSQVSNYDETNHIVTLSLEAFEANIEDMNISGVVESGVESVKRVFAKVSAELYIVVPVEQKELKFSYFNTIKKQFITHKVPVVVRDASVTTQSDLNPKEDSFEKLKKYSLITLTGFFLILFLFKRDFFYLIFGVISFITLLTLYIPHKTICVKQGASLYILPTQTSTMSSKIDEQIDTALLGEKGDYKKVEYKEGIIGWIKNEDLCQN